MSLTRAARVATAALLCLALLAGCSDGPTPTRVTIPAPTPTPVLETYAIPPAPGATPTDVDVQEAIRVLTARLAVLGIEGATVSGDVTGLRVVVPRTSARDDLPAMLAVAGLVEFVPLPAALYGTESAPGPQYATEGQPLPTPEQPLFSGAEIANAYASQDETGGRAVAFKLKDTGAKLFADYTGNHVGEFFAIVLDDVVVSAPYIKSAITGGSGIISGGGPSGFSQAEANDLVMVLRSGPLPAAFRSGQEQP